MAWMSPFHDKRIKSHNYTSQLSAGDTAHELQKLIMHAAGLYC